MAGITLRTARQVVPMIYAYTTPEIARHNGWTKIGYTEQSVDKRLKQQTHTADVLFHEEWRGNAVYDDGSGEVFTDHDFHAYLRKLNVENDRKNEWFHLDGQQSRRYFQDFRMNRGRVQLDAAIAYTLREEQARAVRDTKIYYQSHPGGEYLWNAKPRFGKTLSVYDFCKQVDAQTVLIVTNRPAIANSWYSDYVRFLGRESGYLFVSHVDALAGQPHVLDEQGYLDAEAEQSGLTDLKGKRLLLKKMTEGISAKALDKQSEDVTLSFAADTATEAKQRLEQYIDFIQQQAHPVLGALQALVGAHDADVIPHKAA